MSSSQPTLLSIDFGTTNSTASYRDRAGHTHEVRLGSLSALMPTAVFADGSDLIVGDAAVNNALTDPTAFEPNPKRQLRYTSTMLGGRNFTATSLVAAVLSHIVATATRRHGAPFDRVVLTYPDGWREELIGRLRTSAGEAGIRPESLELLSESQAAAAFYTGTQQLAPSSRIVIFDFGAGTCDVTVLDCDSTGTFSVVASDGLEYLGGNDLDARLHSWVAQRLHERSPELAAQLAQPRVALTFGDRLRDAKETLSTAARATIPLPDGTQLQITRSEFENLIADDIGEAMVLANRVIEQANQITPCPISQIYLVGGSSHIPLVHRELGKIGRLATMGDPKTVVVQGALLHDNIRRSGRSPAPVAPPIPQGHDRTVPRPPAPGPPSPPIPPAPPIPAPVSPSYPGGAHYPASTQYPVSSPYPAYPAPAPPKSSKVGIWLGAIAAAMVGLIVVLVAIMVTQDDKNNRTTTAGGGSSAVPSSAAAPSSSTSPSSVPSSSVSYSSVPPSPTMPRRASSPPAGSTGQNCGQTPFTYTPSKTTVDYVNLNVTVGRTSPPTHCNFAMDVAQAVNDAPGSFPVTVTVTSPNDNQRYTMTCANQTPDPIVLRCSDGRNAEVFFYY